MALESNIVGIDGNEHREKIALLLMQQWLEIMMKPHSDEKMRELSSWSEKAECRCLALNLHQ